MSSDRGSALPGAPVGDLVGVAVAGIVTVLVGFTSSYAIVVQAGLAMGLDAHGLATMTAALGLGLGLTTLLASVVLRMPIVTAWSTPGAALLAIGLQGTTLPEAIGAFVACGLMLALAGATGWFERAMHRIPASLASALLAGVLLRFGIEAFAALGTAPAIVSAMLVTFAFARVAAPRYTVPLTLAAGIAALLATAGWPVAAPTPWVAPSVAPLAFPTFSASALLGVAVPLFVVTMASQNLPGVAVLQASGYRAPVSGLLIFTGGGTLLLAPFGVFAMNLAAISAALCVGPEAHPDPSRRWRAAAVAGIAYLAIAVFAVPIAGVFAALPRELVVTIAGLALLPTIARGLQATVADDREREPAVIAFLVTASGLTLWGVGPAFWGIVFGAAALWLWKRPPLGATGR
jgi:benzoate membrane transport protein